MSRLALLVLVGGLIAWAVRKRGALVRALHQLRSADEPDVSPPRSAPQHEAPASVATTVPPDGAIVGDLVEDDAEALVGIERELLTVPGAPGETHRRRDQTAGAAAQEIAAAQVRARRNGSDELDE